MIFGSFCRRNENESNATRQFSQYNFRKQSVCANTAKNIKKSILSSKLGRYYMISSLKVVKVDSNFKNNYPDSIFRRFGHFGDCFLKVLLNGKPRGQRPESHMCLISLNFRGYFLVKIIWLFGLKPQAFLLNRTLVFF